MDNETSKARVALPTLDSPVRYGNSFYELQGDGRQVVILKNCGLGIAQEIQRRTNAYPQLVAALSALRKAMFEEGCPTKGAGAMADDILRELGEL